MDGMWIVECEMWDGVECERCDVDCDSLIWNVERGMCNVECRKWNVKCGMRDVE